MKYVAAVIVTLGLLSIILLASPGKRVYTVDETANLSETLQGQNISVRGNLSKGRVACTQMACIGEDRCCNTCSGPVQLVGNSSMIALSGEELGCSGTNCNLDCTPEIGKKYIFRGVLKKQYNQLRLDVNNYTEVAEG